MIAGCPADSGNPDPTPTPTSIPEPTPEPTPDPCTVVVTFPDANLEAVIRTAIEKPDGDIYLCDVNSLTSLNAENSSITDLTGIENLTSLNDLRLSNNSISDISALSELVNLTDLNLSYNIITDISPLVANSGMDDSDEVNLQENPLSTDSIVTYIPNLEGRGVTIYYTP